MVRQYLLQRLFGLLVVFVLIIIAALPIVEAIFTPSVSDTPPLTQEPTINSSPKLDHSTSQAPKPINTVSIPDFSSFKSVAEKKNRFFNFLRPYIRQENQRIAKHRQRLRSIKRLFVLYGKISRRDSEYLNEMLANYKMHDSQLSLSSVEALLARVDGLPEALVLMQAANESAWGTSRFAREGNNFFGQWCYRKGCGLVPLHRTEGMQHEVAKFSNISKSVRSYFHNINTNPAYRDLRRIRAELRSSNLGLNSEALAEGLMSYSERGQAYVDDLLMMIRVNKRYISEE